ncbi:MAG: Do family serine endopeptidase, partial [Planctomycetaceae bacterium]
GENGPFGELFRNDPRFRDMFRNGRPVQPREMPRTIGKGSGFIIDESGIILTNTHVVRDAEVVRVHLHDGRDFVATDIKMDPRTDVAIVRIDAGETLPAIKLGNSDQTQVGDWVLAIGSPMGHDFSVTHGIISGKGRGPRIVERENFLQTDAPINRGNSGGPLININGEVIGINTAISTQGGGADGIGFAIPINMARWVAEQLIEKGEVQRAYLGVSVGPVESEVAEQLGMPHGQGVVIANVFEDSPAAKAELQPGDVILQLNGEKIAGPTDLQGVVERLTPGKSYEAVVLRQGERQTIDVTVETMPSEYSLASLAQSPSDAAPETAPEQKEFDELGLTVQAITPSLAEQFGYAEDAAGVLISDVKSGSPAASAGLEAGMLIRQVGNKDAGHTQVASPDEFHAAMDKLALEDGVVLLVEGARGGVRYVVIETN